MDIRDNVFVVTGAGNGIGQRVVLALLARGARVAAVDRSDAGLAETARLAAADDRLSTHVLDVTARDAVERLPDEVVARHGKVDGLLNVAGIVQRFVPISEISMQDITRVMDVNFWGVVAMTKAFLPALLKRPRASLVNVSSMGALVPVPGQTAYGASKAAVKLFTEGLQAELRGTAVAVTVVFPGGINTDILSNSGVSMQLPNADAARIKLTSADAAAQQIVGAVESGARRVRIGGDARLLDRLSRLMPQRAIELVASRMKVMSS